MNIAVIGGGPAGLMAAETASQLGAHVTLYDAMPSVGRKFLVAGKSGLNLTFNEPLDTFLSRYLGTHMPHSLWRDIISNFDNTAIRTWAKSLGIETFTSSSGKVFPKPINGTIRAAPLLRRWIARLRTSGVSFKTRHRLTRIDHPCRLQFQHLEGTAEIKHDAVILALGGASWKSTGSDGTWVQMLQSQGIDIHPLTSTNCGWETIWPANVLNESEGMPIKNIRVYAGKCHSHGELVITRYGLEGTPIYRLGPALKAMPQPGVVIDFKPDMTHDQLITRMGSVKRNYIREARRRLKLDNATCSLLKHLPDRGPWTSVKQLVTEIKHCHLPLTQLRPIEEAISSSGGVCWNELNDNLMIQSMPGVFVAGEMINWEAPTGGYLLQGAFATGQWAGKAAVTTHAL